MPVQRDQELQISILFFPDLLEGQIDVLFEIASDALLFLFELVVDLVHIGIHFGVGLDFGLLVVHFDQSQPRHNITIGENKLLLMGSGLPLFHPILVGNRENLNQGKILKIGPTLNQHRIADLLVDKEMVMPAKNEVDIGKFMSEVYIVVFHHVGQCDYQVAVLGFQLFYHVVGEIFVGCVLAELLVLRDQGVDPLFLGQTEYADLEASFLNHPVLLAVGQAQARSTVMDIAEHPGEIGLALQLHDMLDGIIKIMVTQACEINLHGVQR